MIKGRYTPWDESALKLKTFEILEVDQNHVECITQELLENKFCEAEFIYGRFLSNDMLLKKAFLTSGYIPCETSFKIVLANLKDYELPKLYLRRLLDLQEASIDDYKKIAEISKSMFKFSRFHEDPFIKTELADNRMYQWVNDLAKSDMKCLVNKQSDQQVVSFMIYHEVTPLHVELILGGSAKGFEMHSPFFWGSVLQKLKLIGFNKISTRISAANSGVLSLYQSLGFKIIETYTDYHKHNVSNAGK